MTPTLSATIAALYKLPYARCAVMDFKVVVICTSPGSGLMSSDVSRDPVFSSLEATRARAGLGSATPALIFFW